MKMKIADQLRTFLGANSEAFTSSSSFASSPLATAPSRATIDQVADFAEGAVNSILRSIINVVYSEMSTELCFLSSSFPSSSSSVYSCTHAYNALIKEGIRRTAGGDRYEQLLSKINERVEGIIHEHKVLILHLQHQFDYNYRSSYDNSRHSYDEDNGSGEINMGLFSTSENLNFLFQLSSNLTDVIIVDEGDFVAYIILMHQCEKSTQQPLMEKVLQFWDIFQKCCDGSKHVENAVPPADNSDLCKLYDIARHFQILITISLEVNLMDDQSLSLLAMCVRVAIVLGSLPSSASSLSSSSSLSLNSLVMHSCTKYPLVFLDPMNEQKFTASSKIIPSTLNDFKTLYHQLIRADSGYGFLRCITRAEAVDTLAKYPLGSFLLRPSSLEDNSVGDKKDGDKESAKGDVKEDTVLFYISFRGLQFEGVKHATVRREVISTASNEGENIVEHSVLYRCGKIGPCKTLWDMFHAVEAVLPYEFLYDCLLVPGSLSTPGFGDTGDVSDENTDKKQNRFSMTKDPNCNAWEAIREYVSGSGAETVLGLCTPSEGDGSKLGYVSHSDNETCENDHREYRGSDDKILQGIDARYPKQPNQHPMDNSVWSQVPINSNDLRDLVMNIIRTLAISRLYVQLSRYEISSGSHEKYLSDGTTRQIFSNGHHEYRQKDSCMKYLLQPLHSYSQELQRALAAKVCPARPSSYDRLEIPCHLMMAESLALDMIFYGCLDLTSTSSTSSSYQSDLSFNTNRNNDMNASINVPVRVPLRSINVPLPWITGGSALISNSKTIPSTNNNSKTSHSNLNSIYVEAFELGEGSDWLTKFKHAKSMQKLLVSEAVDNPTPFNILNWMKENRVLRVLKTGGNVAFSSSQTTCLCYVDPWQVTVINDPLQIKTPELTFATLGRHRYCPLDYEGSYDTLIKYVINRVCTDISSRDLRDEFSRIEKRVTAVWGLLGANGFLVSTISSCIPQGEQESLIPPSSLGMSNVPGAPANDMYTACIHRYLYRNLLFARCLMSHRFVAVVHVKILGLKDHTAQKHKGLIQAGPMELYSVATLCRPSKFALHKRIDPRDNNRTIDVTNNIVSISAFGSSDVSKCGINTVVNNAVKVEPFAGKEHYTEYPWKEATIFRFPLPEHVLSLYDDGDTGTTAPSTSSSTSSKQDDNEYQAFFRSPPKLIKLSIYERTFFSDNKLGDIQLPLSTIGEETVFKEWIPLSQSSNRSQAWFLHVQVELNFVLMSLYDSPMGSGGTDKVNDIPTFSNITLPQSPSSSGGGGGGAVAPVLSSPPLERKQSSSDGNLHSTITSDVSNLRGTRSRHSSNDLSSHVKGCGERDVSMASTTTTTEEGSTTPSSTSAESDSASTKTSRFDNLSEMGIL